MFNSEIDCLSYDGRSNIEYYSLDLTCDECFEVLSSTLFLCFVRSTRSSRKIPQHRGECGDVECGDQSGHIPGDSPKTSRPHSFASDGSNDILLLLLLVPRNHGAFRAASQESSSSVFRVLFYLILFRDPLSDTTEREYL